MALDIASMLSGYSSRLRFSHLGKRGGVSTTAMTKPRRVRQGDVVALVAVAADVVHRLAFHMPILSVRAIRDVGLLTTTALAVSISKINWGNMIAHCALLDRVDAEPRDVDASPGHSYFTRIRVSLKEVNRPIDDRALNC